MRNISEADMALSFHNAAGKPIDPGKILTKGPNGNVFSVKS